MTKNIMWVGLDAHKKAINVAVLLGRETKPQEWIVENKPAAIRRLVKKLVREADGGEVRCCYEAGPCGYALQRQIEAGGPVICEVIAPALIPRKPGERIKTDRRDARKLAELLRAGLLTEVQAPTPEQEAVRDLCRAREDAKQDQMRCRHRLGKLLLRRGMVYGGGKKAWTQTHRQWLRTLRFEHASDQAALDDYRLAIEQVEERIQTLEQRMQATAESESVAQPVGWLRCFRGIDTVTALLLVAELHGIERFSSPRELMAYLGLVPSEHSSSERPRRGAITKAGNSHARRLLVEASWHYRHPPCLGVALTERRKGQPAAVIAIADKAQQRLYRRQRHLAARGKIPTQAVVAAARELSGFIWAALLHQHPQPLASAEGHQHTERDNRSEPSNVSGWSGGCHRHEQENARVELCGRIARQDCTIVRTRALRPRHFPTQYGHATLRGAISVTCVYQSDSSSKRPVAFVAFSTLFLHHQQFSTRWRWRGVSNNAPRPAAANSYGAAPRRPSLCASACGELLPAAPRPRNGYPRSAGGKADARKCPRIDDR